VAQCVRKKQVHRPGSVRVSLRQLVDYGTAKTGCQAFDETIAKSPTVTQDKAQ